MICPQCNNEIHQGQGFCPYCGSPVMQPGGMATPPTYPVPIQNDPIPMKGGQSGPPPPPTYQRTADQQADFGQQPYHQPIPQQAAQDFPVQQPIQTQQLQQSYGQVPQTANEVPLPEVFQPAPNYEKPEPVQPSSETASSQAVHPQGGFSSAPQQPTQPQPPQGMPWGAPDQQVNQPLPHEYQQYPAPQPFDGQVGYQTPVPERKPKNKKVRNIIIGAAAGLLVIVVALIGIFAVIENNKATGYEEAKTLMGLGEYSQAQAKFIELDDYQDSHSLADLCQSYIDYGEAATLMDSGDYEAAQTAFLQLGGFEDAADRATECQNHITYNRAEDMLEAADYEGALDLFKTLSSSGFLDSGTRVNECKYALADQLLAAGSNYEAWLAFSAISSYGDAQARADSCIVARPGSSELYRNGDFGGTACPLSIRSAGVDEAYYLKIYSGDAVVSTVFINPGSSVDIALPVGTYSIKAACGDNWFGEADLFGDDGYYYSMIFNDAGGETMAFEPNYSYTLDLQVASGGNVGARDEGRDGF